MAEVMGMGFLEFNSIYAGIFLYHSVYLLPIHRTAWYSFVFAGTEILYIKNGHRRNFFRSRVR
jgi:hypothetical protein